MKPLTGMWSSVLAHGFIKFSDCSDTDVPYTQYLVVDKIIRTLAKTSDLLGRMNSQ